MFNKVISVIDEQNSDSNKWTNGYGFNVWGQYISKLKSGEISKDTKDFTCIGQNRQSYTQSVVQLELWIKTIKVKVNMRLKEITPTDIKKYIDLMHEYEDLMGIASWKQTGGI